MNVNRRGMKINAERKKTICVHTMHAHANTRCSSFNFGRFLFFLFLLEALNAIGETEHPMKMNQLLNKRNAI